MESIDHLHAEVFKSPVMQISEMNPIYSSCWFSHRKIVSTQEAERQVSGAANSGSEARTDAIRRRLQTLVRQAGAGLWSLGLPPEVFRLYR